MDNIEYIDRSSGKILVEKVPGEGMLKWLYNTSTGKLALHALLKRKIISSLGGWYMNSSFSKKRIQKFIHQNDVDLAICQQSNASDFRSFNDFFYRRLKETARNIDQGVVSPADGKILAFQKIKETETFFIKGSGFKLGQFLQNQELTEQYKDGSMMIIRLAPADYHRFHFPADGQISPSKKIPGYYYSVSPLALKKSLEIFCQNKREYSILSTPKHGDILICEVGATMVGGITQTYKAGSNVKKGEEKGYFSFGGSTLVLLFEKDKIQISKDLIQNTSKGYETYIKMGESLEN